MEIDFVKNSSSQIEVEQESLLSQVWWYLAIGMDHQPTSGSGSSSRAETEWALATHTVQESASSGDLLDLSSTIRKVLK